MHSLLHLSSAQPWPNYLHDEVSPEEENKMANIT